MPRCLSWRFFAPRLLALKRLPDLSEADRERIDAMTKAIVKRLLHAPVARLRKAGDGPEVLVARELFHLDGDDED